MERGTRSAWREVQAGTPKLAMTILKDAKMITTATLCCGENKKGNSARTSQEARLKKPPTVGRIRLSLDLSLKILAGIWRMLPKKLGKALSIPICDGVAPKANAKRDK